MGYTTEFTGQLNFNRELTHKEWLELKKLGDDYEKSLYEEYTDSPDTIPNSYLQWVPNDEGTALVWNGGEKFYDYIHWLRWLIKHYMKPRDIVLNGQLQWQGEEIGDIGILKVVDNKVTTEKLTVKGQVECPNCGERFVPDEE